MTPQESLAAALLAIYILMAFPVVYIAARHGITRAAVLGWGYLFVFVTLKIVGSAIQVHAPESSAASIVSNIGLSPLLLAGAGILHQARHYRWSLSRRQATVDKRDTVLILLFHLLASSGIALIGIGASNLAKATSSTSGTLDDVNRAYSLAGAGVGILLVAWLALVGATLISILWSRGVVESGDEAVSDGMKLLLAVGLTLPFLGIRILTSFAYYVGKNPRLSPVGGSMGLVVGLEVVQELIVSIVWVVAGLATRNILKDANASVTRV